MTCNAGAVFSMEAKLIFVHETDKVYLYRSASKGELWIPKSVVRNRTKFVDIHRVEVEDWWARKYHSDLFY